MRFTFNPFAAWLAQPSAADIMRKQLRDARTSRAEHAANAEYHDAMRSMLEARIERLMKELDEKWEGE